ncbi:MAG: hypothetical protein GY698_11140 [Actinomycetia bacterium]|nr:hypothetical protein [Actinomycetes bacterium]
MSSRYGSRPIKGGAGAADYSRMNHRNAGAVALVLALLSPLAPINTPLVASAEAAATPVFDEVFGHSGPTRTATVGQVNRSSSPAVADIDGDGKNDIVIGHQDGKLRVFNRSGGLIWQAEAALSAQHGCHGSSSGTAIDSTPTIADLDGNGTKEIIVAVGSTWVANQPGGVIVFDKNGNQLWDWQGADEGTLWGDTLVKDGYCEGVVSTPAVGDVDGDGKLDIVFGGWDLRIHALDRNGDPLPGFPFYHDDSVWSSPALYDVDGDGRDEIFLGGDTTELGSEDWSGGVYRALDWQAGRVVEMWKVRTLDVFHSSTAMGDIDNDGLMEIVIGSGEYWTVTAGNTGGDNTRVWAFNAEDGSTVAGWPRTTGGTVFSSPAIGDLDGDGKEDDVVVGSEDGHVYAWRGDGSVLWNVAPDDSSEAVPVGAIQGHPIIADLDGNGTQDVAVGSAFAMFILRGSDGARLQTPVPRISFGNAPAVADFGPSGWQLIASGFQPSAVSSGWTTKLWGFSIPTPGSTPDWPDWRGSVDHTAAPQAGHTIPAATDGYWMLEEDGAVYGFGGVSTMSPGLPPFGHKALSLDTTPDGRGLYTLMSDGRVQIAGHATWLGEATDHTGWFADEVPASISTHPSGTGYWIFTSRGRALAFGDAKHKSDLVDIGLAPVLNGPVVASVPTPTGKGYWMIASDGGVFGFGDAKFAGSTGGWALNQPVVAMIPDPDGGGYWLVAADGGIFAFDAVFLGSMGSHDLNRPIVGGTDWGAGYLMLGSDGGIFSFSSRSFFGSLGANPPDTAVVDTATFTD